MNFNKSIFYTFLISSIGLLASCSDDDDHDDDHGEEVINEVVLTFTPDNGEEAITATWYDEDGEGPGAPVIDEIELEEDVHYTMTMALANTLGAEPEDITGEIEEEAEEHMFFFGFTEGIFEDPAGEGNTGSRDGAVNYNDEDDNGLPLGLSTDWAAGEHGEGELRIVLKHQPDGLKTATSTIGDGGTDLDITFEVHVEEGDHNHEEEVVNEIVLTFTPTAGGDAIVAKWFDEDGEGVGSPSIDAIDLDADTEYEMSITLANTLGSEPEDVTEEIEEEGDEHMFFFEFTSDIFSDPSGDGNIDNRDDAVNYNDADANDIPIGLSTNWTTGAASSDGTFRIMLKHQPDLKTESSDSSVGGTDIDIEFDINIQ